MIYDASVAYDSAFAYDFAGSSVTDSGTGEWWQRKRERDEDEELTMVAGLLAAVID